MDLIAKWRRDEQNRWLMCGDRRMRENLSEVVLVPCKWDMLASWAGRKTGIIGSEKEKLMWDQETRWGRWCMEKPDSRVVCCYLQYIRLWHLKAVEQGLLEFAGSELCCNHSGENSALSTLCNASV